MADQVKLLWELEKKEYRFVLNRRELDMGLADPVEYYWMDSRLFRQGRGGLNFHSCVDWWWKTVEKVGETQLAQNQQTLVFAECYPFVNRCRAMQEIYLDAHLHAKADREVLSGAESRETHQHSQRTYALPAEECRRLRDVAHRRDSEGIRLELESLFLGQLPPPEEKPAYAKAAGEWIGKGIEVLEDRGRAGLHDYIQNDLNEWISRLRRRGNVDRVRCFLNMFAYECKVAFYRCYMNAWLSLVIWLAEMRGINAASERLLRIWHNQNQTRDEANADGSHRDVFCGQVLALHPLSGIIMTSPGDLGIIGKLIAHPDYDDLSARNRLSDLPEYWNVMAVILIAAHEYKYSHSQWDATRGGFTIADSELMESMACDDTSMSFAMFFEKYTDSHKIVCARCAGSLQYSKHALPAKDSDTVNVDFVCSKCEHHETIPLTEAQLTGTAEDE